MAKTVAKVSVVSDTADGKKSVARRSTGLDFVSSNATLVRVAGMLQFGAAVPLLIYAATASSRLRHLGVRAAGTTIALVGGIAAAIMLAASGLATVTMGAAESQSGGDALVLLHGLAFTTGGAGTVVFLGLLLAGIAVTTLFARLLPRWLCWATLIVAVVSELATLSLAVPALTVLLAIGRFGGMAALIAAGAQLPTRRPAQVGAA